MKLRKTTLKFIFKAYFYVQDGISNDMIHETFHGDLKSMIEFLYHVYFQKYDTWVVLQCNITPLNIIKFYLVRFIRLLRRR